MIFYFELCFNEIQLYGNIARLPAASPLNLLCYCGGHIDKWLAVYLSTVIVNFALQLTL